MNTRRQRILHTSIQSLTLTCLLITSPVFADDAPVVGVQVQPVSPVITAEQVVELAVIFTLSDGWHIYWQNPGEAGIPTTFDWTLPPGFDILSVQEPVPVRHVEEGITTFIHEDEAIYLFQIQAPLIIPDTLRCTVRIDWLECRSICRAGHAELSLIMPSGTTADPSPANKRIEKHARSQFAVSSQLFEGHISRRGNQIIVNTKPFKQDGGKIVAVDFFPFDEMVYDIGQKPELRSRFGSQTIRIPLLSDLEEVPETLHGVLKITQRPGNDLIISNLLLNETIK